MDIDAQALTTCGVADDGDAISLGFVDAAGNPATIRLSLKQVGALVMTLPTLLQKALQTEDGFSVCFAVPREQQSELGEALMAPSGSSATLRVN